MYTKKPRQSAVFSLYDPCPAVGTDDLVRPNSAKRCHSHASDRVTGVGIRFLRPTARPLP